MHPEERIKNGGTSPTKALGLRELESVVDLHAQIPDRALQLSVAKEQFSGLRLPVFLYTKAILVRRMLWVP